MATTSKALFRGSPVFGATRTDRFISNKALTSNLATITTNAVHGITQVGTIVTITGVDSTFDGTYAIHSIPSTTTFTYVKSTADVSSAAVSPVGIARFNSGVSNGFTISNKVVQNNLATLTTSSAHSLAVGDFVAVTIGDAIYDSLIAEVIAVPTTTTFSYSVTTTSATSTAVSQGAYGRLPVLYTVPSLTTSIVTNVVVTNMSSLSATWSMELDGVAIAKDTICDANSTLVIDLKQVLSTTKTITGSASSQSINFHISGIEVT